MTTIFIFQPLIPTIYFLIKYIIVLQNSGLENLVHDCAAVQVISQWVITRTMCKY